MNLSFVVPKTYTECNNYRFLMAFINTNITQIFCMFYFTDINQQHRLKIIKGQVFLWVFYLSSKTTYYPPSGYSPISLDLFFV